MAGQDHRAPGWMVPDNKSKLHYRHRTDLKRFFIHQEENMIKDQTSKNTVLAVNTIIMLAIVSLTNKLINILSRNTDAILHLRWIYICQSPHDPHIPQLLAISKRWSQKCSRIQNVPTCAKKCLNPIIACPAFHSIMYKTNLISANELTARGLSHICSSHSLCRTESALNICAMAAGSSSASSALQCHLKTLRNIRKSTNRWLAERSAQITSKMERLKIACHQGYDKIQPVRLSKGAVTMIAVNRAATSETRTLYNDCNDEMEHSSLRPEPMNRRRRPPQLNVMNKCRLMMLELEQHNIIMDK